MYDDDAKVALVMLGIFLFIGIIATLINFWWSSYQCDSKWTSFPNRWGVVKGCQIEVGGKWIPAGSYYFKEE